MDDIVIEEIYPYTLDQVWESLTDAEALADWLMPNDFKPVVGHKTVFKCTPQPEFDGTVQVEVLVADKPHKLSYTWKTSDMTQPTIVTYTLASHKQGTLLRMEHTGFTGDNGKRSRPSFKQGWPIKLKTELPETIAKRLKQNIDPKGAPNA